MARRRAAFYRGAPESNALTAREKEVLRLLSEGRTHRAIAARLEISVHTVATHVKNCYRKLKVSRSADAVGCAIERGALPGDDTGI